MNSSVMEQGHGDDVNRVTPSAVGSCRTSPPFLTGELPRGGPAPTRDPRPAEPPAVKRVEAVLQRRGGQSRSAVLDRERDHLFVAIAATHTQPCRLPLRPRCRSAQLRQVHASSGRSRSAQTPRPECSRVPVSARPSSANGARSARTAASRSAAEVRCGSGRGGRANCIRSRRMPAIRWDCRMIV